jgi:Bardet-Biedl syndrome 2 protein
LQVPTASITVVDLLSLHPSSSSFSVSRPLVFAGGNCSIQGFNKDGDDKFWTVTGDNVCSMAICNLVGGNEAQLLVGSEDFDLRVFQASGEVMHEFSETEAVIALCNLQGSRFGYALGNGAIGTYDGPERSWRAKMKARPVTIRGFDMTMDGVQEMVTAWSNGSVDVREDRDGASGEIMLQDSFKVGLAGLAEADYRMDGTNTLLAVSTEGEARGYLPLGVKLKLEDDAGPADVAAPSPRGSKGGKGNRGSKSKRGNAADGADGAAELDGAATEALQQKATQDHSRALRDLENARQDALRELKYYESGGGKGGTSGVDPQLINYLMTCSFGQVWSCEEGSPDGESAPHLRLTLSLPPLEGGETTASIRSMVIFAEGIFEGDSLMVHPPVSNAGGSISAVLQPLVNGTIALLVRLFIAPKSSSTQLIVREVELTIPHFALFKLLPTPPPHCDSSVTLPLDGEQYTHKVSEWLTSFFMFSEFGMDGEFHIQSLRDGCPASFILGSHTIILRTPSMELAAELIPSLLKFLDVSEINSIADFPPEAKSLQEVLITVNEYQSSRQRLSAEMAEKSTMAKNFLFRAEDGRLLDDMDAMTDAYSELNALNRDLIQTYEVRCSNHMDLLKCLKVVNQHIQRAAHLRAGKPKAAIIAGCRQAIKANDVVSLFSFIKDGAPVADA